MSCITGLIIVYLRLPTCKNTTMNSGSRPKRTEEGEYIDVSVSKSANVVSDFAKFSPAWVVDHGKDAPGHMLELIDRIRGGVKKTDWKQLIKNIGSTEKEFEDILPASISSMQKKVVYGKETSERIYEVARLFGLGYDVFDTKSDFKEWLMTPARFTWR